MATNWILKDNGKGRISIVRSSNRPTVTSSKVIYNKPKAKLNLHYNEQFSIAEYSVDYERAKCNHKFLLFNSAMLVYSNHEVDELQKLEFQPVYEDNAIRLLMYKHKNSFIDYWLVCRWREEADEAIEERESLEY